MTPESLAVVVGLASSLAGAGIGYGLTLGRLRTLEKDVQRLEINKASREAHDGLRDAISLLRVEMDRRFDELMALLRNGGK